MREIMGKLVYDSFEEMVDPVHTAVLVVDMQNDFVSSQGMAAQRGTDLTPTQAIVEPLRRLIAAGRGAGARIVYLQNTNEPDGATLAPGWIYYQRRFHLARARGNGRLVPDSPAGMITVDGSWGHAIVDELAPHPLDRVVKKTRPSGFTRTGLDETLRAGGVETVLVAGTRTSACVLATLRDAQFHDYYTLLLKDCISGSQPELDQAALAIMEDRADVVTSADLLSPWSVRVPAAE